MTMLHVEQCHARLATWLAAALLMLDLASPRGSSRAQDSTDAGAPPEAAETSSDRDVAPAAVAKESPAPANVAPTKSSEHLQPPAQRDQKTGGAQQAAATEDVGSHSVGLYLEARCASALCFGGAGNNGWLGIEPLFELPIAKSFAVGNSSLAQYINNHAIALQLAAGVRVWAFGDLISVSLYLSVPLSDSGVRVEGSEFTYPGASIRRPYPGLAIGLIYDIIWIGIDHDELHNGDSSNLNAYNPEYAANARVSSCTTISVALQPVTAVRALFGLLKTSTSTSTRSKP